MASLSRPLLGCRLLWRAALLVSVSVTAINSASSQTVVVGVERGPSVVVDMSVLDALGPPPNLAQLLVRSTAQSEIRSAGSEHKLAASAHPPVTQQRVARRKSQARLARALPAPIAPHKPLLVADAAPASNPAAPTIIHLISPGREQVAVQPRVAESVILRSPGAAAGTASGPVAVAALAQPDSIPAGGPELSAAPLPQPISARQDIGLPAPLPVQARNDRVAPAPATGSVVAVATAATPTPVAAPATGSTPAVASAAPPQTATVERKVASINPQAGLAAQALGPGTAANDSSIRFAPGLAELPADAHALLDGVAARLSANESLRVQLIARASGTDDESIEARRISLARAVAVRSYLMEKGVRSLRMDVRALGNRPDGGEAIDRVDLVLVSQ